MFSHWNPQHIHSKEIRNYRLANLYSVYLYTVLFINRSEGGEEHTVSVDADGQKRGSGRYVNSSSCNMQCLSVTLNWLHIIFGKISWCFVVQDNYLIYMLLFWLIKGHCSTIIAQTRKIISNQVPSRGCKINESAIKNQKKKKC